ncbi:MAG: hypothetical protein IPQ25_09675 [Chitinophagaceae bacterium]|nr:hypothetical protein [Chitinophagaceae bacterium]
MDTVFLNSKKKLPYVWIMDFLPSRGVLINQKTVCMQSKFTLNQRRRNLFGLSPLFLILFFLVAGKINSQQYVNGNLSTGATSSSGVAAPAGTTWSEVQGLPAILH